MVLIFLFGPWAISKIELFHTITVDFYVNKTNNDTIVLEKLVVRTCLLSAERGIEQLICNNKKTRAILSISCAGRTS